MIAQVRKELVAAAATAVAAYVAAWTQVPAGAPGWPTVALAVLLGIVAGLFVLGTRNARPPLPEVAQHIRFDGDVAPAVKMAVRAAQHRGGRLM